MTRRTFMQSLAAPLGLSAQVKEDFSGETVVVNLDSRSLLTVNYTGPDGVVETMQFPGAQSWRFLKTFMAYAANSGWIE